MGTGTSIGLLIISFMLLVFGVIIAVGAHLSLQEIQDQRASLGGLGGVAINLSDFLGSSNVNEMESQLEAIRWGSVAAAILGLVLGAVGVSGLTASTNSKETGPSLDTSQRPDPGELGIRRGSGTHTWSVQTPVGPTHAVTIQAGKGRVVIGSDGVVLGDYRYHGVSGEKRYDLALSGQPAYVLTKWGWSWVTHQLFVDNLLIQ